MPFARAASAAVLFAAALQGCAAPEDTDTPVVEKTFPETVGGQCPADVIRPADFSEDETLPVIILLHGYAATSYLEDVIFHLQDRVDTSRFLLVMPEGNVDAGGFQFWNASEECCNFSGSKVNDVKYLSGLADEMRAEFNVSTVAFVGHSNGGYMGYRLACDAPESFDRLMVLAGSGPVVEPDCDASAIPLLHVHATADDTITYDANEGAGGLVPTVGAVETVRRYAAHAGCDATTTAVGTADLTTLQEGEEASGVAYASCPAPVALWTIEGGDHYYLNATDTLRDGVVAFALGGDPTF